MFNDNFDENWDEHQWGRYIQEMERKTSGLKQFIDQTWGDPNDPNWVKFLKEYESVEEALNAYLDEELSFDDAVYLDNGDENEFEDQEDYLFEDDLFDDDDEDEFDDFFDQLDELAQSDEEEADFDIPDVSGKDLQQRMDDLLSDEERDFPDHLADEFSEDDDENFPDFGVSETDEDTIDPDNYDPFFTRHFDVFEEACSINHYLMFKGQEFPNFKHHQQFNMLVDETLAMTAKLSSATTFEPDDPFYMGAIIAYCKRSLYHANRSLHMLFDGRKDLFDDKEYAPLHKQLFELRNNLSLFIYEIREYFEENK